MPIFGSKSAGDAADWEPQAADSRLAHTAGADPSGVFTSDLSVSEYVLLGEAGFEPLGFVVGSSIYHIGLQAGRWVRPRMADRRAGLDRHQRLAGQADQQADHLLLHQRLATGDPLGHIKLEALAQHRQPAIRYAFGVVPPVRSLTVTIPSHVLDRGHLVGGTAQDTHCIRCMQLFMDKFGIRGFHVN
jgi:hypothetical protein